MQVTGRGNNQTVSYVFGQLALEPDGELVTLLASLRKPLVAAKKATPDSRENVRHSVAQARVILGLGCKPANEVDFVLDVVRLHEISKYAWPEDPHRARS
ncbi:hypothetical protein [Deinococcus humi]|uniref:Uncharacterized protein n=1 Tax=Deinococcus humi TaxID=662880 RepID=A0A7W8NFA1_9DEIO|nr:hypothetical protein [Deinococcus humi]MBB5363480.1 hypothetical protein [Deinococcus humi]GGO30591.1 hypothetical protein GCM10008949_25630 [Deinococcus humi]